MEMLVVVPDATTVPSLAEQLCAAPDFTIETFPERHHFDPPHRIEPARLASSLLALWRRAESITA
jgi:hypothetical protein